MYKSCKLSVVCVPFSQRTKIFLPPEVQTGCGIHPVSCSLSTGRALSQGVKWLGLDADYLPPSSAEVKDDSPIYAFKASTETALHFTFDRPSTARFKASSPKMSSTLQWLASD